jgi:hypothetical protein
MDAPTRWKTQGRLVEPEDNQSRWRRPRDGCEIDIMEKPWLDERVQHTFGLLWLPDEHVFYVDGKETWRSEAGGVCQVPQYMLLSDEIGNWAGDIAKAKLPDQFLVDYVRVYDLVDAK